MRLIERLAMAAIQGHIVDHLIGQGVAPAEAHATAAGASVGGLPNLIQWVVTNLPAIYGVVAFVLAMFGVPLPPLPQPGPAPTP